MLSRQELQTQVEQLMEREVEQFMMSVPYADHLIDEQQELNEHYYLRHRIETIKRIRMTSKTDSLALAAMIDENYDAARPWGRYTAQELNHDLLFMKDLKKHGYTDQVVADTEPFPSTLALIKYLTDQIHNLGALPAVAYSVFVEWNSAHCSAQVVEKAEKTYSSAYVLGSKAHVGIDEDQNHYEMMIDIAHRLLINHENESILMDLIKDISTFFCLYFEELYERTILQSESTLLNALLKETSGNLDAIIQTANQAGYDVEILSLYNPHFVLQK